MRHSQTIVILAKLTFCLLLPLSVNVLADETKMPDKAVKIAYWKPVTSLDPANSTTGEQIATFEILFSGLVAQQDSRIVHDEAKSWKISMDRKTYTFKLRDDIFWSDGKPVTAHDYVLAFQRLLDPNVNAGRRPDYLVMDILNALKVRDGKVEPSALGVKAEDDKTLVFQLENPASYFLNVLAYPGMAPVPSHMVEKHGDDWWKQQPMVSNGSYQLRSFKKDNEVILDLHDKSSFPKAPQTVHVVFVKDIEDAMQKLLNNQLDVAYGIRKSEMKWISKRPGFNLRKADKSETTFLWLNTNYPNLQDSRVRHALYLAINTGVLAQSLAGKTANSFAVPSMLAGLGDRLKGKFAALSEEERLETAKKLLEQAGYGAENLLEITIIASRRHGNKEAAYGIRSMLSRINVRTNIEDMSSKEVTAKRNTGEYQVAIGSWVADYNDAMTFYAILEAGASQNHSSFKNSGYNRLLKEARSETNAEVRLELYAQLEEILREEVPVIPLAHTSYNIVTSPRIKQKDFSGFTLIDARQIEFTGN